MTIILWDTKCDFGAEWLSCIVSGWTNYKSFDPTFVTQMFY